MPKSYSIAEARDRFAKIVHAVDDEEDVVITRRGKPVAVLVSYAAYRRMSVKEPRFWDGLMAFRRERKEQIEGADLSAVFEGLRDSGVGREVSW